MTAVTFDANILSSGALSRATPPGQLLNAWEDGLFELVLSEHILDEVHTTLRKAYFQARLSTAAIVTFEDLLREKATIVPLTVDVRGVATHPEDDLVLATAVSGDVQFLVTGDARFRRAVPTYRQVQLLSAREFLEYLARMHPDR